MRGNFVLVNRWPRILDRNLTEWGHCYTDESTGYIAYIAQGKLQHGSKYKGILYIVSKKLRGKFDKFVNFIDNNVIL